MSRWAPSVTQDPGLLRLGVVRKIIQATAIQTLVLVETAFFFRWALGRVYTKHFLSG